MRVYIYIRDVMCMCVCGEKKTTKVTSLLSCRPRRRRTGSVAVLPCQGHRTPVRRRFTVPPATAPLVVPATPAADDAFVAFLYTHTRFILRACTHRQCRTGNVAGTCYNIIISTRCYNILLYIRLHNMWWWWWSSSGCTHADGIVKHYYNIIIIVVARPRETHTGK